MEQSLAIDPVSRFLAALRDCHSDMVEVFTRGQCYSLFLLLRTVWPDAEAWFSKIEGHVYIKIDGAFYDIRGKHFRPPADLKRLDHKNGDRPHRWGGRDKFRMSLDQTS